MLRRVLLIGTAVLLFGHVPLTFGQQVHVATPIVNISDSFYESFGIDWGYRSWGPNGGFFFNRGGSQGTIPPFGGFDPASAGRFGFSHQGSNHGFFFNFTAAQGSNRTITSSTPSVTLSNGAIGSFRDVQMRPFVTGLIPVVGSSGGYRVPAPTLISPLKERLARLKNEQSRQAQQPTVSPPVAKVVAGDAVAAPELKLGPAEPAAKLTLVSNANRTESTAERGDIGVSEIRRRQEARVQADAAELARLIEDAKAAEKVGRFGAARVRYRQAAARATGAVKRDLLERLELIRDR